MKSWQWVLFLKVWHFSWNFNIEFCFQNLDILKKISHMKVRQWVLFLKARWFIENLTLSFTFKIWYLSKKFLFPEIIFFMKILLLKIWKPILSSKNCFQKLDFFMKFCSEVYFLNQYICHGNSTLHLKCFFMEIFSMKIQQLLCEFQ